MMKFSLKTNFPKYNSNKSSELLGLDTIPHHWEPWKMSHGYLTIGSGTTPKSDNGEYYDGDINWVTTSELRENEIEETFTKITRKALIDYPTLTLYSRGSLAIAMYGATIGRLGFFNKESTVNQACCVFSSPIVFDQKFVFYWLLIRKRVLLSLSSGGGQPNLSQETLKQIRIPIPPLEEQQSIAQFLDRKTAKIDALIGQKEKLLKLLTEKRTAIISQAVTKGLDPKVKMKDSGIEWLGEVPEHWIVKKLKYLSSYIKTGITPSSNGPDYFSEGTVNWYAPGDFDGEAITLASSSKKLDETVFLDTGQRKFPAYSVLVVGIGATLGKVGMALEECTSNQQINAIYPSEKFDSKFLTYFLITQNDIMKLVSNSTTLGIMNQEKTKNLFVATPPIEEQTKIVQSLDIVIGKIDDLKSKTRRSIEKLKEYRSALITSAVTGQIDVRKEVA